MKRVLIKLLALALIVGFIAVALAPVAVRQYRLWRDGQIAGEYLGAANAMSPLDCGTLLTEARNYDAARQGFEWSDPFAGADPEAGDDAYEHLLNPAGNGVMAVLEIPKLAATLPVYHGTRDAALGAGVGHLANSGLPVGDGGAPCVLAARRGRWFAGPFSGLDRLIIGDCFYIRVLQDTLIYEVYQTLTVEPEALDALEAGNGADECVLITTTPYGVDTQRLLVRARRVARRSVQPSDDTQALPPWAARLIFAAPVAIAGLAVLFAVEGLRRAAQRRKRRRMRL